VASGTASNTTLHACIVAPLIVQLSLHCVFAPQLPRDKEILAAQMAMEQEQARVVVVPPSTFAADMARAGIRLTAPKPAGAVAEPGVSEEASTSQAAPGAGEQGFAASTSSGGCRQSMGLSEPKAAKRHRHEGVFTAATTGKAAEPDAEPLSSQPPYVQSAARLGIIDQLGPPDCELAGTGGTGSLSSSMHEAAGPVGEPAVEGGAPGGGAGSLAATRLGPSMSTSSSLGDLVKTGLSGARGPPWHLPAHRAMLGGERSRVLWAAIPAHQFCSMPHSLSLDLNQHMCPAPFSSLRPLPCSVCLWYA
jgi:hypothetical protein